MAENQGNSTDQGADLQAKLLDAALMHVAFDGWTRATWDAAVADSEVDPTLAEALFPRRALDLAVAYHKRGDALMLERLKDADLSSLRFRDRVAAAVRYRLEAVGDKEAVRRGATLFALPQHAAEGTKIQGSSQPFFQCTQRPNISQKTFSTSKS